MKKLILAIGLFIGRINSTVDLEVSTITQLFETLDADKDGLVSMGELKSQVQVMNQNEE